MPPPQSRTSKPALSLFLPEPISDAELAEYSARLSLTGQAVVLARAQHDAYLASWHEIVAAALPGLQIAAERPPAVASAATDVNYGYRDPEYVVALESFFAARDDVLQQFKALDESFLNDLIVLSGLEDPQLSASIALTRSREAFATVPFDLPWAILDVLQLMRELRIEITGNEELVWHAREYDRRVARLRLDVIEQYPERTLEHARRSMAAWYDDHGELLAPDDPQLRFQMRGLSAFKQKAMEQELEAAERAGELNLNMVDSAIALLPPEDGKRLLDLFRERAFFEVYPDPGALHEVFDLLSANETLESDVRDALAVIDAQYRERHGRMCDRMTENFKERRVAQIRARGTGAPDLQRDFDLLHLEREELNLSVGKQLQILLGTEHVAAAMEAVRFERMRARGDR
ncbi:MAG: hypothetical protein ACR2GY_13815 [Phycisphaerales bacterium]